MKQRCFILSTAGQARNAVSISQRYERDKFTSCFYVVGVGHEPHLNAIERILCKNKCSFEFIKLPKFPNNGLPKTIYHIFLSYQKIILSQPFDEIWVANNNSHYSMLCHEAASLGLTINFFEDGLSSYKRFSEIAQYQSFLESTVTFLRVLKGWVRRRSTPVSMPFGNVLNAFLRWTASFGVTRLILYYFLNQSQRMYFSVYTDFERILAVFPELLDKKAFNGERIVLDITSPKRPLSEVVPFNYSKNSLELKENIGLFISQIYGSGSAEWFNIIADALKDTRKDVYFIRFHPRENRSHRFIFMNALKEKGVRAFEIDTESDMDANDILASGQFNFVVGLTSSSLLYGPNLNPASAYVSICEDVIHALKRKNRFSLELIRLQRDFKCFKRIFELAHGGS